MIAESSQPESVDITYRRELRRRITDLQAEVKRLKELLKNYGQHTHKCASRKRHYDPHCPACNSIEGRWLHGVGFENDRVCNQCGHSWEPGDVFPPCDCGFKQALKEPNGPACK